MKIKFFLETLQYFSLKDRYLILLLITLMIFGALLETTSIVLLIPLISFLVENDVTSKFLACWGNNDNLSEEVNDIIYIEEDDENDENDNKEDNNNEDNELALINKKTNEFTNIIDSMIQSIQNFPTKKDNKIEFIIEIDPKKNLIFSEEELQSQLDQNLCTNDIISKHFLLRSF